MKLIRVCVALEFLDDGISRIFGNGIEQSDFSDVLYIHDILLDESRFRDSRDGMDQMVEILRNEELTTEEQYKLLKK